METAGARIEEPVMPAGREMILELNFVPKWARKPPAENPYKQFEKTDRRDNRRGGGRPSRGRRDQGGRSDRSSPGRARAPARETRQREYAPREEDWLPVDVSFIPERQQLGRLVRQIHDRGRAYPLMDLASMLLAKPELHLVKVEGRRQEDKGKGLSFYQCVVCKVAFMKSEDCLAHVLAAHSSEFYDMEEVDVGPPAGNFICIARCKRSGEILGPPNYHGYNERVREVQRTRFPHLTLEEYRNQIETVHDEELIEKWKKQCSTQRVYRPKGAAAESSGMNWQEVEAHFAEQHAAAQVVKKHKVIFSEAAAQRLEDSALKRSVHDAWMRESRFPRTISFALRPAFRHMRLELFKVNGGHTFVTGIPPRPIKPDQTIDSIGEVLRYLEDNPGCTRQSIVDNLRPGKAPESEEVAQVLNPLRWLIERGHVIEFFDGTLAVPSSRK
ncbi:MAG: hypothetical protein KJ626_06095 [Verrucomicrobia bacterium]|nr:hypothetical protein [Verrucomicrobiota bacterium]